MVGSNFETLSGPFKKLLPLRILSIASALFCESCLDDIFKFPMVKYTDLECYADAQKALVLDSGSGTVKIGFSGEDEPRAIYKTVVGMVYEDGVEGSKEDARSSSGTSSASTVVNGSKRTPVFGDAAVSIDPSSKVSPIWRGKVVDKDALESLWEYCLQNEKVHKGTDPTVPILVAVSPQTPLDVREWMAEVFLEKFNFPSLAISSTAGLSLYSTGETTGMVVDLGHGITSVVPVFEGFSIPYASLSLEVAGADISQAFKAYADGRLETPITLETAEVMKEKLAFVRSKDKAAAESNVLFELPDGTVIKVPEDVRSDCTEILFPKFGHSLSEIVVKAFKGLDSGLQAELARNIHITGGSSLLPGLSERLHAEISSGGLGLDMKIKADGQRKLAAWIGGSMFSSLSTFEAFALKKKEYEEGNAYELVAQRLN